MRIEDKRSAVASCQNKIGDEIHAGDSIGAVFCEDAAAARRLPPLSAAYEIGESPVEPPQLIKEVID